jgi:integrase
MAGCRTLTPEEVEHVRATFGQDFQGVRNHTLFLLGVKTGFRISELLSLRVGDVWQGSAVVQEITVAKRHRKQKTSSHRVALHEKAQQALEHCLQVYQARAHLLPGNLPLFPGRQGDQQPITRYRALQILQETLASAGLTGRLGTHTLRKTFAKTMYYRLNENIFKVQQTLGHKWITSTQAYLPINDEEIRRTILA